MQQIAKTFDEIRKSFEAMPLVDKLKVYLSSHNMLPLYNGIYHRGYVTLKEIHAVRGDTGQHYVYLWKHINGSVFYVGSGKNDRCINKNRCCEFLKHIDAGDAVVYIVLKEVDAKTAHFYERYISYSLSEMGEPLTNKDNIIARSERNAVDRWYKENQDTIKNDFTRQVENVLMCHVYGDMDFKLGELLGVQKFREQYGDTYFSDGGFVGHL